MTTILTIALTALMFGGGSCEARQDREERLSREALVRWVEQYDREHPVVDDADKEAEEAVHRAMWTH